MNLNQLRNKKHITQMEISKKLGTSQANISRLERRPDMYITSLRKYLHAMGGKLKISAHFSDEEISISQFDEASS